MADVLATIKSILNQRDREIVSGSDAVRQMLDALRKQIVGELAALPAESFTAYRQRQALASIEKHLADFESAAKTEGAKLITSMWEAGGGLLTTAAAAGGTPAIVTGFGHISANIVETLKDFTFGRYAAMTSDLRGRINARLTLGVLGQATPQQIAGDIAGSIDNPSIFKSIAERAEVITQTEMGRAFSVATQKSMEGALSSLPGMKKLWIHAGHPRMPRQVHLLMHGQTRAIDAAFYKTAEGASVLYPRDPKAPIKEVIRCGCTHVPHMDQWGSADDFAAAWDQADYRRMKRAA